MNTPGKGLDFEVDKLTNSIENTRTGEVFRTEIIRISAENVGLLRRSIWQFDWLLELRSVHREVFALTTVNEPLRIEGLISISDNDDHIFMHLLENAERNKGKGKEFAGVAPNLVAFACKRSFDSGYRGSLAFVAKTSLIDHYITSLGAKRFSGNRMFIEEAEARTLVTRYFGNEK